MLVSFIFASLLTTAPESNTWAFQPKPDDFRADAMLNLRSLNEKFAGENGFIAADAKGDFVRGDGAPIRFWAVGSDVGSEEPYVIRPRWRQTPTDLARHAKFLAKRGVNMIRIHCQISPNLEKNPNAKITDADQETIERIWRVVTEMKKQGIYTTISPYWMVPMKFSSSWGLPDGAAQRADGLLFFEPKMQAAYKEWLRRLFTTKNPKTGIPLADDPALAIIQIQNEDSLLFWTVNAIEGQTRKLLGRQFGTWLKEKYGSFAKVKENWQGVGLATDDWTSGTFDFYNIWEMTQTREGGMNRRLSDQLEFWSRTMFNFNKDIGRFLKQELKCKQIVNAGNWKTANASRLNDPERWSYTANEVDAVNNYFNGVHKGPNEGWSIETKDVFTSPSVTLDPTKFPLNIKQTRNRPMMVTESMWVPPAGFASEAPFLVSAYQSLSGIDAYYWFATGEDEWTPPQSANGYNDGQQKWIFGTPDVLGGFPAAAFLYRMGLVKQGAPVLVERRTLSDLWERRTPLLTEEASFDPNRDAGDIAPTSTVKTAVDPKAFFVGPVQVEFSTQPKATEATNLKPFIDAGNRTITSNTKELVLDYGNGFCRLEAPAAAGVTGFLSRKRSFAFKDFDLFSQNEYGTFLAVALDKKPLGESSKILLQLTTSARPKGWQEKPTQIKLEGGQSVPGFEVVSVGSAPWMVASGEASISFRNPKIKKATILDENGNAVGPLATTAGAKGLSFKFPSNRLYVMLTP